MFNFLGEGTHLKCPLQVLKCTDWSEERMTEGKFFKLYKEGRGDGDLYKLKDWPPNAHFSERLGRHNQVCCCIHCYSPPALKPLTAESQME